MFCIIVLQEMHFLKFFWEGERGEARLIKSLLLEFAKSLFLFLDNLTWKFGISNPLLVI